MGHLGEGGRKDYRAEACVRGFCGGFKEAGLWMLPGSRGHSMIGHLSDSCLRGRMTRVRLKL